MNKDIGIKTILTLVSPTKYDWRDVALSIVGNNQSTFGKARAIFDWLCDNITYDTSYKIHNADAAWEKRKGVCQAYCEIFYRLGLSVGLDVRIVSGRSKNRDGEVSKDGHAWIAVNVSSKIIQKNLFPESITYFDNQIEQSKFASTRGLDKASCILIDPTWGAGAVVNGRFLKGKNRDQWFNVKPEWFVFSHFPENPSDQLLGENAITQQQFFSLPYLTAEFEGFGFDCSSTLFAFLTQKIQLPEINPSLSDYIQFEDIPLQNTLRKSNSYNFIFKKKRSCTLAIFGETSFRDDDESSCWKSDVDYSSILFNTGHCDELCIGLNSAGGSTFTMFLTYKVL